MAGRSMKKTHGMSRTPEYESWCHMKARCYNPNNKDYYNYGARGITVCDEWKNDFLTFLCDVGYRPSVEHSLDRINGNLNYNKDNCRWATALVQSRNRPDATIPLTFKGKTLIISEWAEELGIRRSILYDRFVRGWPVERLLTAPPSNTIRKNNRMLEFRGETKPLCQWAYEIGLTPNTLKERLSRGWSVEKALTSPKDETRMKTAA